MAPVISVAADVFALEPEPRLLASRCQECGRAFFPRRPWCRDPRCPRTRTADITLDRVGVLYSYATQHYPAPVPFQVAPRLLPYTLLLVELPEGLRVLGMLAEGIDVKSLRIGLRMRLMAGLLHRRADGTEVLTWKFEPFPSDERG